MPLHKLLGKSLARLKPRRRLRRPEDTKAPCLQRIHDTERKWKLRPHNRQRRPLRLNQAHHLIDTLEIDRNTARHLRNSPIARRANQLRNARTALRRPGKGVLAATRSKDQYFHWFSSLPRTGPRTN